MRASKALKNFLGWVLVAIIVNWILYFLMGEQVGLEFLGGYIIELSLSVDNLFLFLIIFSSFNIPVNYQKKVLTYGIIGAIIFRFIFIFLGVSIVNRFHWMLYVFSIFLMFSGIKIFFHDDEEKDLSKSKLLIVLKKVVPFVNNLYGDKLFVRKGIKIYATPLFLTLLMIEFSDIVFALDSIPAIFAISTKPVVIYLSNILAVLGLRSLYFILAKLNNMFKYIKYGVAIVLIFTGVKLFILYFNIVIPTVISLLIIIIILLASILFSLIMD